jgi:ribonuclease P/MRP protein subunit RPP1
MNEKIFQQCCSTLDIDIISLNLNEKLPFHIKHNMVGLAIQRGIHFELSYAASIAGNKVNF